MAAAACVLQRTLVRSDPHKVSSSVVCMELLSVVELRRYTRDPGSSIYFPLTVLSGDDLYDVTLTDGDCRLQVTLNPTLNWLVEQSVLEPGAMLRNATFSPTISAPLACTRSPGETDSYRLVSVEVAAEVGGPDPGWDCLPWFGPSEAAGPAGHAQQLLPLRASRTVFLPLWNNVDYSGPMWRVTPPTENAKEEQLHEGRHPGVTVSELREYYLSRCQGNATHTVRRQLIVRIDNKSHLMYYGRADRNCECPYKAVLEMSDQTGSVCVVLWNSVCVDWYRCLKPGDVIGLRRFRVKRHYQAKENDIEISVNSRNPAAEIQVLPASSVSPHHLPINPVYSFYSSIQLLDLPHGTVCDFIGLLVFSGRPERLRKSGRPGAELLEYRWLRLEDGKSSEPIMVKLFATSQPDSHSKLHPLSMVVCTRLKVIRAAGRFYLSNTMFTQVYCTGLGHHSEMSYRTLQPVRHFLRWVRGQDDNQVLGRALVGGSFIYPPPPVSLDMYMRYRRGEMWETAAGWFPSTDLRFLRGAELQRELESLCYRERRTFCVQAVVAMVTYSRRGQEDRCYFWTDRASSSSPPTPMLTPPHQSSRTPLASSSSVSPASPALAVGQLTARRTSHKRKLLQGLTPQRRRPMVTLQPEQSDRTVILFEASKEFLGNTAAASDSEDEDAVSFVTAPSPPTFQPIALETLAMRFNHARQEEQAVAVGMGGSLAAEWDWVPEDYYVLRLRALSDGVTLDAVFLPHASSAPLLPHPNTWTSTLSHGAFSSDAPPPSPADLINMAAQLTNQKLLCVLEACHLGGSRTELVLSRAFRLSD